MTETVETPSGTPALTSWRSPDVKLPKAGGGEHNLAAFAVSLLIFILLIGAAEISARNHWVSSLILPAPSDVWQTLVEGFKSGRFETHIRATMTSTLLGFVLSAFIAIVLAGVLASFGFVEKVVMPFIVAFQALPKIAVAPLVIIWLGFGSTSKTMIVVIITFFPILINSLQGFRLRQREYLELMQVLGGTRWQIFRYIRLPSALPYVFSGLHVGIIFSLLGAVVAEFISAQSGLGYALLVAQAQFDVAGVFAMLIILMVIGIVLNAVMQFIENRLTFWAQEKTNIPL